MAQKLILCWIEYRLKVMSLSRTKSKAHSAPLAETQLNKGFLYPNGANYERTASRLHHRIARDRMSKTILAEVDGWTPVIDAVVLDVGIMSAVVFGKAWRYCQMSDGVCKASQERIADELGISRITVNSHFAKLVEAGYLKDTTPHLLGLPHIYVDTGKAGLSIILTGGVNNINRGSKESLQEGVKNIDSKIGINRQNKKHINISVSGINSKIERLRNGRQ